MTKIWKKDFYEKLMKKKGAIQMSDLWDRQSAILNVETQTRSASNLHKQNLETLAAILTFYKDHGDYRTPSRRELQNLLPNIDGKPGSLGKVNNRLQKLYDAGLIDFDDKNSEIKILFADTSKVRKKAKFQEMLGVGSAPR